MYNNCYYTDDCDCEDCTDNEGDHTSDECQQCTSGGFHTEEELQAIVDKENKVMYSMAGISVIPDLNFTMPGTVAAWYFAARHVLGTNGSEIPQIQLWRPLTESEQEEGGRDNVLYMLRSSIEMDELKVMEDSNLITYQLTSGMAVQAGDIVGVEQPENSQLLLMFQPTDDNSYTNYITRLGSTQIIDGKVRTMMRLPLLRPEFDPFCESIIPLCDEHYCILFIQHRTLVHNLQLSKNIVDTQH